MPSVAHEALARRDPGDRAAREGVAPASVEFLGLYPRNSTVAGRAGRLEPIRR